jgi:hypothetical protein
MFNQFKWKNGMMEKWNKGKKKKLERRINPTNLAIGIPTLPARGRQAT